MRRFTIAAAATLILLFTAFVSPLAAHQLFSGQIVPWPHGDGTQMARVLVVAPNDRLETWARSNVRDYYKVSKPGRTFERAVYLLRRRVSRMNPGVDLSKINSGEVLYLPLTDGMQQEITEEDDDWLKVFAFSEQAVAANLNLHQALSETLAQRDEALQRTLWQHTLDDFPVLSAIGKYTSLPYVIFGSICLGLVIFWCMVHRGRRPRLG